MEGVFCVSLEMSILALSPAPVYFVFFETFPWFWFCFLGFRGGSAGKQYTMQETWVWSLGQEDTLEKEMATHSSILAWKFLGHRILVSYNLWGHKELNMTSTFTFLLPSPANRVRGMGVGWGCVGVSVCCL